MPPKTATTATTSATMSHSRNSVTASTIVALLTSHIHNPRTGAKATQTQPQLKWHFPTQQTTRLYTITQHTSYNNEPGDSTWGNF